MKLPRLALAAVALLGALLLTPAAAQAAAAAPSWDLLAPNGAQGRVRESFSYTAEPGQVVSDSVQVVNTGSDPLTLELYAADAFTTDSGEIELRTREHEATGAGSWIVLSAPEVTVQPGATATVPFTVEIPADAHGEAFGGIVASITEGDVETRSTIQVSVRLGEEIDPGLEVTDIGVSFQGDAWGHGKAMVRYRVHNTGDVPLGGEHRITLTGPFGWFPSPETSLEGPVLLPGESRAIVRMVDGATAAGLVEARIEITPLYTDPAGSTGPLHRISSAAPVWGLGWAPLAIVGVIVAGAIAGAIVMRRPRH